MLNPARLPVIEEVVSRKLDAESPVAAFGGDVAEGQRWSMLQVSGEGSSEAPCSLTPQASPPKAKRKHDGSVTSKGGGGRHGDEEDASLVAGQLSFGEYRRETGGAGSRDEVDVGVEDKDKGSEEEEEEEEQEEDEASGAGSTQIEHTDKDVWYMRMSRSTGIVHLAPRSRVAPGFLGLGFGLSFVLGCLRLPRCLLRRTTHLSALSACECAAESCAG